MVRVETESETETTASYATRILIGVVSVVVLVAFSLSFTLRESEKAIVLQFGQAVRVVEHAGLHFKAPWPIERTVLVDGRIRAVSTPLTELLTRDKKNIVVITSGSWSVTEPVLFHRALGSIREADEKIGSLLVNATIAAFGRYDLSAVVSTTESSLRVDKIEREIVAAVNEVSSQKYGVRALHAGFQRISLPENNIDYVLEQMRAERREHAAKFRADGQLEAARIRSTADLESAEVLAKAAQEAAEIRGEAEAEAARIYAEAYALDPALYRFLRSLESIEKTLGERSMVTLRTDSEPFRLLLDPGHASTKSKRTPSDSETSRTRTSAPNYSGLREPKPEEGP